MMSAIHNQVKFQLATRQDISLLAEVMNRAFDELSDAYKQDRRGLHNCSMCVFKGVEDLGKRRGDLDDGWLMLYKMVHEGKIVGGFCFDFNRRRVSLNVIFVDLPFQNQGIGSQAIQFITEFARNKQALKPPKVTESVITCKTPEWAVRNHRFYEKNGFVKVTSEFNDTFGFDDIIYHKCIDGEKTSPG